MTTKKTLFLLVSVVTMLSLLAAGMLGQSLQKDNVYRHLSVFTEVLSIVNNNYVEQVSPDQLLDGAFEGVTQAVDEFSFYVPPADMDEFKKWSESGEGKDVGVSLTKRFGYAYVIASRSGSPAAKAGLGPGDFIEKIDGTPTEKMAVWQVLSTLHATGPEGRKLTVVHGGMTKREEITLTFGGGDAPSFEAKEIQETPYFKVVDWNDSTVAGLEGFLKDARSKSKETVLIDVRGNASDSIEAAVKCADLFLSKGLITSVAGRRVEPKSWNADKATLFDGTVLVLTDPSTAGAGEVFAAAIAGNARGQVVGLPTYGRAIVQKTITLPSGGGVRVTIGHYTTPDLKPIKDLGVKPDVMADRTIAEPDKVEEKSDPVLQKALSLLAAKPAKAAA